MQIQKILLISENIIFTEEICHILENDFLITIHTPVVDTSKFIAKIKKNLFDFILFIDDEGVETFRLFTTLVKKNPWIENRIIFVTSFRKRKIENLEKRKVTFVLYGDIVTYLSGIDSSCTDLLRKAKQKKQISISPQAMPLYPVFFEDIITSIRTILSHRLHTVFCIFPKEEISALTFVRILQKIDPEINITMHEEKASSKKHASIPALIPQYGKYLVDLQNFEEKLQQTYNKINTQTKTNYDADTSQKGNKAAPVLSVATGIFIALFIVFISLPIFAAGSLFSSFFFLSHGQYEVGKGLALFSKDAFFLSEQTMGKVFSKSSFALGRDCAEGVVLLSDALGILSGVENGNSLSEKELLYGLNLARRISEIKQRLITEDTFSKVLKNEFKILDREEQILLAMTDILPDLAGYSGERHYLLLFQNNDELRPGGGFIGSYGILALKNGKINQFAINDVYDADGQLKGHIEPPLALKEYMGASHWFLRDSNFAVDFPTNARNASFLLEKETGQEVDGVIAIDTTFIKNILSAVGKIEIPDFQTSIDSNNFTFFTQEEIQKNFFPGSRKKKNLLTAINHAIVSAIFNEKRLSFQKMASLLTEAIDQKHVMFVSFDDNIQDVFSANGFSSTLIERRVDGNIMYDFFGINDANIGENKVNAYVDRKIYHQVEIMEHARLSRATILYMNKSDKYSLFGGEYKNFMRIILPTGSVITGISLDGKEKQPVLTNDKAVNDRDKDIIEIEKHEEMGKVMYGMYLLIPELSTKVVQITYTTSQNLGLNKSFTYDQLFFKQPGTNDDLYSFSISFPKTLNVVRLNKQARVEKNEIVYSEKLQEDLRIITQFTSLETALRE